VQLSVKVWVDNNETAVVLNHVIDYPEKVPFGGDVL